MLSPRDSSEPGGDLGVIVRYRIELPLDCSGYGTGDVSIGCVC